MLVVSIRYVLSFFKPFHMAILTLDHSDHQSPQTPRRLNSARFTGDEFDLEDGDDTTGPGGGGGGTGVGPAIRRTLSRSGSMTSAQKIARVRQDSLLRANSALNLDNVLRANGESQPAVAGSGAAALDPLSLGTLQQHVCPTFNRVSVFALW